MTRGGQKRIAETKRPTSAAVPFPIRQRDAARGEVVASESKRLEAGKLVRWCQKGDRILFGTYSAARSVWTVRVMIMREDGDPGMSGRRHQIRKGSVAQVSTVGF